MVKVLVPIWLFLSACAVVGSCDEQLPLPPKLPVSLMWATPLLETLVDDARLQHAYRSIVLSGQVWQEEHAPSKSSISVLAWASTLRETALDLFDAFQIHAAEHGELSLDGSSPQHINEVRRSVLHRGAWRCPGPLSPSVTLAFRIRRPSSVGSVPSGR